MRMPSVHTFGIRIHPLGTPGFSDQAGHTMVDNNNGIVRYRDGMINGNMILNGPANLQLLQQALPNVQLLKVSFMSDTDHKAALFKVGFLRQLPKLRGITCFCQNTSLTLVERDVLSTCHAAFKAPAVHWQSGLDHKQLSQSCIAMLYSSMIPGILLLCTCPCLGGMALPMPASKFINGPSLLLNTFPNLEFNLLGAV